jgi:hypothetical protein
MRIQLSDTPALQFYALPLPERAIEPSQLRLFFRELRLMLSVIALIALAVTFCGGVAGVSALAVIELILRP